MTIEVSIWVLVVFLLGGVIIGMMLNKNDHHPLI